MKIQIIGDKVCLRCKGKKLLGVVNKLFVFRSLLTTSSNALPLHLKQTFPPINLNFHSRWRRWDWIQAIFLNLFYFNIFLKKILEKAIVATKSIDVVVKDQVRIYIITNESTGMQFNCRAGLSFVERLYIHRIKQIRYA